MSSSNNNNSSHPAMKELYEILKKKDWTEFCPEKIRTELLNLWVDKWLVDLSLSQDVVNTKNLTAESSDTIKIYLAQLMAEELAEVCTLYKTKPHQIQASMIALRRKPKI